MSDQNILIEPMDERHYPELLALWSTFSGNALTGADSVQGFTQFLSDNSQYCFVANHAGAVVGSVMAGEDSRRGYIYHLAVKSDLQGRGVGRTLMEKAEDALCRSGIEKIHLFIFSDNPAIEFYRKIGWHLRDDIVVMSKVLKGDTYMGTRRR